MKLLFESWRSYLNEVMQLSVSDYRNPRSDINIFKNKLGIVYRLGKPLNVQNTIGEEFKVTFNLPHWLVVKNNKEQKVFKDIPEVVDYLIREKVDFKTAGMTE